MRDIWFEYFTTYRGLCPYCLYEFNASNYAKLKGLIPKPIPLCQKCNNEGQSEEPIGFISIIGEYDDRYILKTTLRTIKEVWNPIKWEKNRNPDKVRINDIRNYFNRDKVKLIPGIIYLALLEEECVIYEGNHRFNAANDEMEIVVSLLKDSEDIDEDFRNINKLIQISEDHLDERKRPIGKEVDKVIYYLEIKYEGLKSPNPNCQRPRFNSQELKRELVNSLPKKFNSSDIIRILEEINKEQKKKWITYVKDKRRTRNPFGFSRNIEECEKNNCWIFCLKTHELLIEINNKIEK